MQRYSILAVDDDPGDLEILRRHLEEIPGWTTELCALTVPAQALKELEERNFDLIFLDHFLGAVTGLDLIKRIRSKGIETPIVMLTGHADHRVAMEIIRSGASDYLVKGDLSPDLLRRVVESAIVQHSLRREKRTLEEDLRQAQKLESIGQLAGGIAHDFNNMLTGIMGYVELAMLKAEGTEIERDLCQVQQTCRSMSEVIQQLLALSRRERRRFSHVDLNKIVQETQALLVHSIPKNIIFDLVLCDEPLTVNGSGSMLQQALLNLCINAAEAMPDGGELTLCTRKTLIRSDSSLAHSNLSPGEYAVFEVQDTGVGIEPALLERLFDPFFTTKSLSDRKGTGLGLAVVWRNIREHGGYVSVRSAKGAGSTFQVFLPLKRSADKPAAPPVLVEVPRGSERILVVDDEQVIRGIATQLLERLGYTVCAAADGAQAVSLYEAEKGGIDLVLLDVSMPVMNGPRCFERLRHLDPAVRVVFSSGHERSSIEAELKSLGTYAFIQKPYTLAQLATSVRHALDNETLDFAT